MELKNIINSKNALLKSRFSVRKYDESVKISKEELSNILQDAMTAPSSLNLQPWRFVVISSPEGKELIKPYMMFNALQWETSSAIIAVFGDYENISYVDSIYSEAVKIGVMPEDKKEKMIGMIKEYSKDFANEKIKDVFMFDCGLVSMQIMLSAKNYGYDTNPIGGYLKKELTEALGLDLERYFPVILISIGKADEPEHDSIRFSVDDITQWV